MSVIGGPRRLESIGMSDRPRDRFCRSLILQNCRTDPASELKAHVNVSGRDDGRMRFRCLCGAVYAIVPKEIPLARAEIVLCECGCPLPGQHSTRFFDYERID